MSVANHEGANIRFPATFTPANSAIISGMNMNYPDDYPNGKINVIGVDIPVIAYQSATVTTRPNTQPVSAIGYRGVAAISDLQGSVEVGLEGILVWATPSGAGGLEDSSDPGYRTANLGLTKKGLLDHDLYDYVSEWGMIVVETRGADSNDNGKRVCNYGMFLTSVSYTFAQNTSVTTSWNFVGYNAVWEDSDFSYDPDAVQSNKLILGQGNNFVPLTSKDIDLVALYPTISGTDTLGDVQSVTFNATINRDEVYRLGDVAPFDRPVRFPFEVSANVEVLADSSEFLEKVTPSYKWNRTAAEQLDGNGDVNKMEIYVYRNDYPSAGQKVKICGAPYQRPVDGSMRISVGANSTCSISTTGWEFQF